MAYFFWIRFRRDVDAPGVAIFFDDDELLALVNFIFRLLDSSSLFSSSSPNDAAKREDTLSIRVNQ